MAGIAVCAVFMIAVGAAVSALLYSGLPIPRHAFILDIVAKLQQAVVNRERDQQLRMLTAA